MKELAKEYKQSLRLLSKRISKLKIEVSKLALQEYSPERDKELEELRARIKLLSSMLPDLKAVTKEVDHYYDRSWWRSETYTTNSR